MRDIARELFGNLGTTPSPMANDATAFAVDAGTARGLKVSRRLWSSGRLPDKRFERLALRGPCGVRLRRSHDDNSPWQEQTEEPVRSPLIGHATPRIGKSEIRQRKFASFGRREVSVSR
ncbi:unnamed protein product, partial [Iphiclides podalirius]